MKLRNTNTTPKSRHKNYMEAVLDGTITGDFSGSQWVRSRETKCPEMCVTVPLGGSALNTNSEKNSTIWVLDHKVSH